MKGKFIVFEGIDGCGKGTQLHLAAGYIFSKNKDYDVYITREPTRDYKDIRKKLASNTDAKKDGLWFAQMFVKDRINHINNYITPSLNKGTHVLCDRYKYSTLAFQQAQGVDLKKLLDMHQGLLIPDLILIFDCPAEIAYKRRQNEGATEVFDKDLQFQRELRQNYLNLKEILKNENIQIIDASKPISDVFESVKLYLDKIL